MTDALFWPLVIAGCLPIAAFIIAIPICIALDRELKEWP